MEVFMKYDTVIHPLEFHIKWRSEAQLALIRKSQEEKQY